MGGNAIPIEMGILIDDVRRTSMPKLSIDANFLKLMVERICFAQVLRIAKLTNKISGSQQRTIFANIFFFRRGNDWETCELNGSGYALGIEDVNHHAIKDEQF
jgi:hypothetical protein